MLVLPTVSALAVERGKAGAGAGPWQTGRMTISGPGADRAGFGRVGNEPVC
jgi:hypothetical protein